MAELIAETAKSTVSIEGLQIGIQPKTVRDLYASWYLLHDNENGKGVKYRERQEKFEWKWRWDFGTGHPKGELKQWFEGGEGECEPKIGSVVISPPENAGIVEFYVRAVAKKRKVEKKDSKGKKKTVEEEWYTCKWASIQFTYKTDGKLQTHHVEAIDCDRKIYYNTLIAYWKDTWYDNENSQHPRSELAGFDYRWMYYNGRVWIDSDSGTASKTPSSYPGKSQTHAVEWSIPAEAQRVKFYVKPVPVAEYIFLGEERGTPVTIKKIDRQVKNVTITLNDQGNLEGLWQIDDKKYLESFNYEWSYYQNGIWTVGKSGSVPIENNVHGNGPSRSWGDIYTPPTIVDDSMLVRLRVLPVGQEGEDSRYNDEWSPYTKYYLILKEKTIDTPISAVRVEGSARTYEIKWGLFDYDNVASFDYEAEYQLTPGGIWIKHTSGSVDVSDVSKQSERLPVYTKGITNKDSVSSIIIAETIKDVYTWYTTYDAPENAIAFQVRVKVNPTYENAFVSTWSKYKRFRIITPIRKIDELYLQVYNQANRTMQVVCFMEDTTNVASYHVIWEYFHRNENKKAGMWFPGQEEDVTLTSKGGVYGYGVNVYELPADADTYRVTAYPNPTTEGLFIGDPLTLKDKWVTPMYSIDADEIAISIMPNTDRDMIANWSYKKGLIYEEDSNYKIANKVSIPMSETASFEYQWRYRIGDNWFYESSETVPDILQRVTSPYTAPENADVVSVRIRPVPIAEGFYIGSWSDWTSYKFDIPPRAIEDDDISLSLLRGTERTVACMWTIDDISNIVSYSYKWRYFTVDGFVFDGTTGSATVETPSCTYDAPANASVVGIKLVPEPAYSTSFAGEWSREILYEVPEYDVPADGVTPTVRIEGHNLVAQVDIYDEHADAVEFHLVRYVSSAYEPDDDDEIEEAKTSTGIHEIIQIINNRATWITAINSGPIYRVRSRGVNSNGEVGGWSQYSEDIYATPAKPTIKKVEATSSSSFRVTVASKVSTQHVTELTLEYVVNNESYFDTNPSAIQSMTITSGKVFEVVGLETAGRYYFRVKATNSQGDSEWSDIKSQLLGTVPSAPTTWSSTTTATVERDIWLYWIHNSEDQSTESSAILEITVNGTTTTYTIENTSGSENYTGSYRIAGGTYTAGAKVKWRVRTKGVVEQYGPYSTMRVVDIFAPPTITMSIKQGDDEELAGGGTLTHLPLKLTLAAGPVSQTPVSYNVSIISNNDYASTTVEGRTAYVLKGSTVYNKYISTTAREFTMTLKANDFTLESDYSYTIKVSVTMNSGLTAEITRAINVKWEKEDIYLNAQLRYDPTNVTMQIRPFCEDEYENIVANVRLGVYRREFDGSFVEIASNIANNNRRAAVVDPHPSLDYARYRITATSQTTGRIFFYDLPAYGIGETSIVIQWDEEWQTFDYDPTVMDVVVDGPYRGSVVFLPYNIDTDESNDLDLELVNYIGRRHPVSYYGTQVGQTANWKADIPADDTETIFALRRLAVWPGDVYVREPSGVGYWANVKVSFSITHVQVTIPVSISITRVEGGA